MKHASKVHSLTRSLMGLFVTKKRNITFENHPYEYYKNFWLNKKLSDGIELVAQIELITKKRAAELIVTKGLSSYMGAKITKYIEDENAARELNQKVKMTRFVRVLRKYARERGMDIRKFI